MIGRVNVRDVFATNHLAPSARFAVRMQLKHPLAYAAGYD